MLTAHRLLRSFLIVGAAWAAITALAGPTSSWWPVWLRAILSMPVAVSAGFAGVHLTRESEAVGSGLLAGWAVAQVLRVQFTPTYTWHTVITGYATYLFLALAVFTVAVVVAVYGDLPCARRAAAAGDPEEDA